MRKSIQLSCVLVVGWVAACDAPKPPPTVAITLPDALECMAEFSDGDDQGYAGDIDSLWAAIDLGDPDAMLCSLAIDKGREDARDQIEMLYRWYRATGQEPEGLDERIRRLNRGELESLLRMAHDLSPELTAFRLGRRGCPDYDEIATELLLRAEMGDGDRHCLPRRGWW